MDNFDDNTNALPEPRNMTQGAALPEDEKEVDHGEHHGDHQISGDGHAEAVTPDAVVSNTLPDELQRVYDSARWVPSKNTRIQYPTPRELIDPFLDEISTRGVTANFNAHTAKARTVQENDTDTQHTAYGRVLAEAEFGEYNRHDTIKTVGLVYDLTRKDPLVKVYAGHNVRACTNLCVFNATHVYEGSLLGGGEDQAQGHLQRFFDELPEAESHFCNQVDRLKNTYMDSSMLNELLGRMLRNVNSSASFGAATLNYTVKLLDDDNSRYALDANGGTTAWNLLNAMTQFVTDRKKSTAPHLVPSKTLEICQEVGGEFLDLSDVRRN